MAYMRMRRNTWFEYNPLTEGQIVEVPDEVGAQWKKDLLAGDATKEQYDAQLTLDQAKTEAMLAEAEQTAAGGPSAILRDDVEALETESSGPTRTARR